MKYLLTFATLFLVGCGSAEEANTAQTTPVVTQQSSPIDMVLNKSYGVSKGDRVGNASADAEVKVVKNIEDEATAVTLVAGSAQLIRKDQTSFLSPFGDDLTIFHLIFIDLIYL